MTLCLRKTVTLSPDNKEPKKRGEYKKFGARKLRIFGQIRKARNFTASKISTFTVIVL